MTTTPTRGQTVLFSEHVAEIWTEERRKVEGPDAPAIQVDRVYDFLRWSKPTPPGVARKHRYEGHPMPYPRATRGPRTPVWLADQEADLAAWWHDREDWRDVQKIIADPEHRAKVAQKAHAELADPDSAAYRRFPAWYTLADVEEELLAKARKDAAVAKARKDEWKRNN